MRAIDKFPYFPIEFDKSARVARPAQLDALRDHLAASPPSDLVVISHGWNNNMEEADALYEELLGNMDALAASPAPGGLGARRFAVLGVLWPSKKFEDSELIASGAAGVTNTVAMDALRAQLDGLRGAFDAPDANTTLAEMKALLARLEDSDSARSTFVELARSLVQVDAADGEDESRSFMKMDPLDVYERLQKTPRAARAGAQGGAAGMAAGEAAGLGDLFKGVLAGARNVLNFTTYYQMKARAGLIGAQGLAPILRNIRNSAASPLRIHLVGHSFGGRLVTAAAAGTDDASMVNADSLSLLQAAFSHHGFSADFDGRGGVGFFRRVVDGNAVSGPIVITCTTNDKAVGLAYPIASMLAGQNASALGDKDSLYGGIGSNGAQKTNEAIDLTMLSVGGAYSFTPKRLHNLNADAFIADHSDVRNREVAYAVLCAIAATP